MALPINIEEFDEYIRQGELDKKEKAYIWQTAIGLQKEMSAYEWAKGHSGVLLADGCSKKGREMVKHLICIL